MKYDDASWHYEGDYPADLAPERAAVHIGMFLKWCIRNGFASDDLKEDCEEEIQKVMQGEMTGAQFLIDICDEKLLDEDLSETGIAFANDYYEDGTEFGKKYSYFIGDFCDVFNEKAEKGGFEYDSLYHVEDTDENYALMAKKIDERFQQWAAFKKG
ncbi:hypothetical protein SOASR030_04360 [Leminorella grimontii]|uniref:DUF7832 domain-containing protein n=1 Tax=Leminorella grimontii TaxID=82981 RepID=A0AAV5MY35_9GAMM|nr:hypothetical protein [Leminorella grimontii]KFC96478.1 hypothetical protein GLGR_1654 [Leminorella grimontii ATCC 33999 = DSM 5078]GKX54324.1 hypothetical protein SOASR030_04360 [Leminorella grimontii]VFS59537.1 Uncharacterised protein [Leminorella grimontii]